MQRFNINRLNGSYEIFSCDRGNFLVQYYQQYPTEIYCIKSPLASTILDVQRLTKGRITRELQEMLMRT